jgi:ABC-type multidrug transport system ATPase subunit
MAPLEIHQLDHSFSDTHAWRGVTLSVQARAVYGFLGPNGAGKTTTIRCILGLIRARAGRITINGTNLKKNRCLALRGVGAVVETPALFPGLTGRENLETSRLMLDLPKTAVDRVLELVDMRDHADRRSSRYSLGMRQRIGLARALLGKPSLLVLDEPTNGLDPAGIRDMRNLIKALPERENTTVFMSSHLLSEVEQTANHVALMKSGQIVFEGQLSDLLSKQANQIHIRLDRPQEGAEIAKQMAFAVDRVDETHLRLVPPPDLQPNDLATLNSALVKANLLVSEFRQERADLESIFMSLTTTSPNGDQEAERT